MAKIYIDPGHGGHDGGASGSGLREKDWVLEVSLELARILKQAGHSVKLSRSTDNFIGLTARTNEANRWGADIFISIHFNAGGGFGWEDFIFDGNVSNNTRKLQNSIHDAIKPVLSKHGMKNRGKKRANFAVLRQSRMPAILLEGGFVDTSDVNILKKASYKKDVAVGIANGVQKYFGLSKVSTSSSKNGWKKESDIWYYYKDGKKHKGWIKLNNLWYYLNSKGELQTGWFQVKTGGPFYYADGGGRMQTGWLKDGGRWFYLFDSGRMATGLHKIDDKYYFFNLGGRMTVDQFFTLYADKSGEVYYKNPDK